MFRFLEEDHADEAHSDEENVSSSGTPWGPAIGAAITVQLTTLSGIIIISAAVLYRRFYVKSQDSKGFTNLIWILQHLVVPSFAVGALLATAVFLIIPEALNLLGGEAHSEEGHRFRRQLAMTVIRSLAEGSNETEHAEGEEHSEEEEEHEEESASANSESQVAWKFGAAFLGGFIFPILLGVIFPEPEVLQAQLEAEEETKKLKELDGLVDPTDKVIEDAREVKTDDDAPGTDGHNGFDVDAPPGDDDKASGTMASNGTKGTTTVTAGTTGASMVVASNEIPSIVRTKNIPLAGSILIGDFFHNLADGFFIGSAFLLCSKSIGWTLVATTIYHEIAQEIADYVLLTTHCGLTIIEALVLNFLSGSSVMLGVVIILSVDLDGPAIGSILAVSAGVYVYIAVGECVPRVQDVLRKANTHHSEKVRYTMIFFLCFVFGAVPIGLVLLNHEHCEAH